MSIPHDAFTTAPTTLGLSERARLHRAAYAAEGAALKAVRQPSDLKPEVLQRRADDAKAKRAHLRTSTGGGVREHR